jgi:hypothetical protein
MMKKSVAEIIERSEEFADSFFLADKLQKYGEDLEGDDSALPYYLKECAVHIEGMYGLLMEAVKILRSVNVIKKAFAEQGLSLAPPAEDKHERR